MSLSHSTRKIWLNRMQAAFSGLVVGSILWTINSLWQKISQIQWQIQWEILICSVILQIIVLIGWAFAWTWLLGKLEAHKISPLNSVRFYIYANAAKYIPGPVWNFFARAYLGGQAGFRQRTIWTANLFEFIAGIFTGFLIYALSLFWPHAHSDFIPPMLAWGLPALLLFLISPLVINRLSNLIKKNGPEIHLEASTFCLYLFISICTWIFVGFAFWLFLISLEPKITIDFLPEAVGLWAIAVAFGMVAIGFPQGIGIKETVLIIGLGFSLQFSHAFTVALLARAWIFFSDLLAMAVWWLADIAYIRINPSKQGRGNP
jgi:glycosyltransferase 2 family protein